MPSNYGRAINQTNIEQLTATISGIINGLGGDMSAWREPSTHYGQVLSEIERGVPDEEISAAHPGWCGDVLKVCHKIADGTLSKPSEALITDEQFERRKKMEKAKEKERMAAYRRRYGKSRDL